jgi:hypothetical protein
MKQEELKEEMRARLEEAVEELAGWKKAKKGYNFDEIESKVLEVGRDIMREMIGIMVQDEKEEEQRDRTKPEPACESCGRPMRYRGEKSKGVMSKVGKVEIERDHYHCPECKAGLFPPGSSVADRAGGLE